MEITMSNTVKIYIDAAHRNNKSISFGVIAHLPDGTKKTKSGKLPEMTSQEAEFAAVGEALSMAVENKWPSIEIYTDSRLVVQSSTGHWKLRSPNLLKAVEVLVGMAAKVKMLQGDGIKMQWLSREDPHIQEVDALCNRELNPSFI